MQNIFYKFWKNLREIFRGKNLLWHLLAIILTYLLVISGFDWKYFLFWNDTALQRFLFGAAILGGLLPIFLPVTFYLIGKFKNSTIFKNTAYATLQAGFFGSVVSSVYKAFTGRMEPPFHFTSLVDISRDFQFGFLRHGIFWGWPSSHTTIAFAIAVTLFMLYPKSLTMRIFAIVFAFYVGIGVSMSIHWFSDFVAGAIIGSLIGYVVGKTFLNRLN